MDSKARARISSPNVVVRYGAFYAAVDAAQGAYVADLAHGNLKATALGTLQTVTGLVALLLGLLVTRGPRNSPEACEERK